MVLLITLTVMARKVAMYGWTLRAGFASIRAWAAREGRPLEVCERIPFKRYTQGRGLSITVAVLSGGLRESG